MSRPCHLFVTGKLAEPSLRRVLAEIAPAAGFDYGVAVLPISVVALATTSWVARHLQVAGHVDRIILPGLCNGDPDIVSQSTGLPVERGPKDLRDLPEFCGAGTPRLTGYGAYDISILAEINHVQNLPFEDIRARAVAYRASARTSSILAATPESRGLPPPRRRGRFGTKASVSPSTASSRATLKPPCPAAPSWY